ncbi:MAG: extracellular solute-binding protein [Clostridiales bacterium]|nr:extracellular solute-binding protein [Clostridiales bacterium]
MKQSNINHSKMRKMVALILGISMLITTAGCKKKNGTDAAQGSSDVIPDLLPTNPDGTPHGDYILDSDPYYSDTSFSITIPDNEARDRKPDRKSLCDEPVLLDESVAYVYFRTYELTEEEQQEMESLNTFDREQCARFYELLQSRQELGILFYSLSGEQIANVEFPPNYEIHHLYALRDGTCIVNCDISNYASFGEGEAGYYLLQYNGKGELIRKEQANPLLDLETTFTPNMDILQLSNGQLLFYHGQIVFLMDEDWSILKKAELVDSHSALVEVNGKCYEIIYDTDWTSDTGHTEIRYRELDLDTFTFSEEKALDGSTPSSFRLLQDKGELYTDDGEGLVRIDPIAGTRENLFRWGETDIYGMPIDSVRVLPSGDIVILSGMEVVFLQREATNPYAGRRILKVGINELDTSYYPMIRAYNKRPESLGRVYVYFPDGNPYGFETAQKADAADRLVLEMRSGEGPDILLNYSDYGQFETDALLVDLNPYIDSDKGLDRNQYFDNVFRAFEVDGKLYQIPMTFTISALFGNPDALGNISDWTIEDFSQKMGALPDGMDPLWYYFESDSPTTETLDGKGILLTLLYHDMLHYVDYSRGVVNFDSDEFRMLLQSAKLATPKISKDTVRSMIDEYLDQSYGNPYYFLVQDGICSITPMELSDLWSYGEVKKLCQGNAVYIGWPTMKGTGLAAEAKTSIGISAFSSAKDEAWDFVRFIMSAENQTTMFSDADIPDIFVNRESEEASLQKEIDRFPKELEKYGGPNSSYVAALPMFDQELADDFVALVERVSTRVCKNPTIMEIVREEVPAYFDGSKSAEEVSKIIQSRASTVMAESQ